MTKTKKQKNTKWIKPRHCVVTVILRPFIGAYTKLKYHIKVEKFIEQNRPHLVLFNHQTAFDQFFVGMAFKDPIYYVASEDLFSNGFVSSVIRYLVAPIPIKKQTADVKAIMTCMRVAKEGGSIAIAPEGNRTFSGKTEYINPSIVPLAKKLNMPIVLYRIEGGYGVHPRWSDVVRRGKMRSYVARIIEPEEYKAMSNDELYSAICDGLHVCESTVSGEFKHRKRAEYLERAMYVCPTCGLTTYESHGNTIKCLKCGQEIEYLPTKQIIGVNCDFPFEFVNGWYEYQSEFVNSLDVMKHLDEPLYTEQIALSEVIPYKRKVKICKKAKLSLFGNKLTINTDGKELGFAFDKTHAITILGKNKLNVYFDNRIYQIKGNKRFNALKYVHIYHRHKNILRGDSDGKFLGL